MAPIWVSEYDYLIRSPQGEVTFALRENDEFPGTFLVYMFTEKKLNRNHYGMVHLLTYDQMKEIAEWFIQQPIPH